MQDYIGVSATSNGFKIHLGNGTNVALSDAELSTTCTLFEALSVKLVGTEFTLLRDIRRALKVYLRSNQMHDFDVWLPPEYQSNEKRTMHMFQQVFMQSN